MTLSANTPSIGSTSSGGLFPLLQNTPVFTTINKFDTLETNFYGSGTVSLDTTTQVEGAGAMVLTLATGGNCGPRFALPATTDFTNKAIKFHVKASDWNSISTAEILLANESGISNFWVFSLKGGGAPFLTNRPNGEYLEVEIHPSNFLVGAGTPNWTAITHCIIRGQASAGTPTLSFDNMVHFASLQKPMICFTFDDGLISQYTIGLPRLQLQNMKGTFFGIWNERTPGVNLEATHLDALSLGGHDIGGHGGTNLTTLSATDRVNDLRAMKNAIQKYRGNTFYALPNGAYNAAVLADINSAGFSVVRTVNWGGMSPEYAPQFVLNAYSPSSGTSLATMQGWIDNAITYNYSLIITIHGIVPSAPADAQITTANYNALVDYAAARIASGAMVSGTLSDYMARGVDQPSKLSSQSIFDSTITAPGITGNRTINKPSGTVNIAATGTSVTVTNSLVTVNSQIFAVIRTNDSTATIKNIVPSAGSFVITLNAAATAEVSIGFLVVNN